MLVAGRAGQLVMPMWHRVEPAWGPARDVHDRQPLMALTTMPTCAIDPGIRQVKPDELDTYLMT